MYVCRYVCMYVCMYVCTYYIILSFFELEFTWDFIAKM